jgi:hypothetical protein
MLGVVVAASTALAAAPVMAAGTPDIGFKVPAHAHANKPTTVRWHARGVGNKTVVLQGYNGNDKSWGTFRHLQGDSGKTKIPSQPIGIYDFRIAVFDHSGKLVAAKGHKLHVFGKIRWSKLFPSPPRPQGGEYGSFHWVFSFFSNDVNYAALKVTHNPCSSVHIKYIPGTQNPNESVGGVGTVLLSRHGRSAVKSEVAAQHLGKLHGKLPLGKAWTIHVGEDGAGSRLYNWYFNGTAVCDQQRITSYSFNQN